MNRTERDDLIRLVRARAKLAKQQVTAREKVLVAEIQDLLAAEYSAQDQLWAEATTLAEEAVAKANAQIEAQCRLLGIPPQYAPKILSGFFERSRVHLQLGRKEELVALARAEAENAIDAKALESETELVTGSLESADAKAFVESMPTAEALMPALSLDDLGVTTWQPPDGAAAELLTPLTPADRKRRQIARAIAANPEASDRAIAKVAGVDHTTVAAYRRNSGESTALPGGTTGESPGVTP